jgi:mannose-6-phosphate isomerase
MATLYPMLQQPVLKTTLWGGRKLESVFSMALPEGQAVGEAWLVADHPHGTSTVANGPMAGMSLREVIETHGDELFGSAAPRAWRRRFPLLVKIIDAHDDLSVQVHPDERAVAEMTIDDSAKTECWVILDSEPGSTLITGVQPGADPEAFRRAAAEGRLESMLIRQAVTPGDVVFVPAGRLHAIGKGIVLAEFQQPSDTTYRVYDWGRVDSRGTPRPLHLDQAIACTNFEGRFASAGGRGRLVETPEATVDSLVECPQFNVHRAEVSGGVFQRRLDHSFEVAMITEGEGFLTTASAEGNLAVRKGQAILVPAVAEEYELRSDGRLVALLSSVPED